MENDYLKFTNNEKFEHQTETDYSIFSPEYRAQLQAKAEQDRLRRFLALGINVEQSEIPQSGKMPTMQTQVHNFYGKDIVEITFLDELVLERQFFTYQVIDGKVRCIPETRVEAPQNTTRLKNANTNTKQPSARKDYSKRK